MISSMNNNMSEDIDESNPKLGVETPVRFCLLFSFPPHCVVFSS
jgi:hypothetical protein